MMVKPWEWMESAKCIEGREKGKGRKDFTGYVREWLEEYKSIRRGEYHENQGGETLRLPPTQKSSDQTIRETRYVH